MNVILCMLSGTLLALAFPKFDLFWLAWVALVPFFIALSRAEAWKESLLCGFFFGAFFFGIHLFWVNTLFRFVQWWIVVGWISLVLFQTLFILLFCFLQSKFCRYLRGFAAARFTLPVLVALLWIAVEWIRAWGPFGVTAGDLGYSQASFLPLIQIASITSVYGVSFLIVLVNAAIADVVVSLDSARDKKVSATFLILVFLLVMGCYAYGSFVMVSGQKEARRLMSLALIQPNVDQKDRLRPDLALPIFKLLEEMTRQAMQEKPDLIIWPETAVFSYLLHDPHLFPRLKQLAEETKAWLVVGTPHYVGAKAYNSVVSISPAGKVVSRYDKQQLVPFGEYLPFRAILYPFLRGVGYYDSWYSSNPRSQLIEAGEIKIATAICFESTFHGLIRKRTKKSADFILTVTNDAWFGDSSAAYFHLNTGVFRAIENRRYFVQAGNTGISAVIDPYGRILKRTELNQREILTFEIPLS